jgi:FSR family fosmidomycin resistance protein-like MFS transporter
MTPTAIAERPAAPPAAAPEPPVHHRGLWLLAAGHAVTDTYGSSFLAPMFPLLAIQLHLTLGQIGGLTAMMGLAASLGQPIWGYMSDRWPRVYLVALGPAFAAVCCSSVGLVSGYWPLALCLFATGMGVGAFHPQAAALARAAGRGRGLAMSVFTVGGNVGYGVAPLLATLYLAFFGLRHMMVAAVPGLVVAVALALTFRHFSGHAAGHARRQALPAANRSALGFLTATVVVRSAVQIGLTTFLPFLVARRFPQLDPTAAAGIAVSSLLLASAVSGPLGGHFADRWGARRVMVASFLLAPLPLAIAFQLHGFWFLASLALGGFILMLPHPANVVMAQEFMPRSAGIAASMITGLAWGVAQFSATPLGIAAQHVGIEPALRALCLVPLLGAVLVLPIPDRRTMP